MKEFEISEATLAHLNDLVVQNQEIQTVIVDDYCNCTGFGG